MFRDRGRIVSYTFFGHLDFGAAIYIPFLLHWAGMSLGMAMLIDSILLVGALLADVPGGWLADRWGRARVMALGAGAMTAGLLLYAATPHVLGIAAGALLMGLSSGGTSSIDEVAMVEAEPRNRLRNLSLMTGARQCSRVLAAVLGAWVAARWGLRSAVLLYAVPLALSALVALRIADTRPERRTPPTRFIASTRQAIQDVTSSPPARRAAGEYVAVTVAVWVVWSMQAPILEGLGVPLSWLGVVYGGFMLMPIIGLPILNAAVTLHGRPAVLLATSIAIAVSVLSLALIPSIPSALLAIATTGFAGFSRNPLLMDELHAHLPGDRRATSASVISSVLSLVAALAFPLAGFGWEIAPIETMATFSLLAAGGGILAWRSRTAEHGRTIAAPTHIATAPETALDPAA